MNIGKLKHHVTIEQKLVVRNTYGEEEVSYTPFIEAWCEITPLSGTEFFLAQQTQSSISHKIRLRYHPGIKPEMRLVWGTRVFDIGPALNVDEADTELLIYATESI